MREQAETAVFEDRGTAVTDIWSICDTDFPVSPSDAADTLPVSCVVFEMSQASLDMSRLVDIRLISYLPVIYLFVYGDREKETSSRDSLNPPLVKTSVSSPSLLK